MRVLSTLAIAAAGLCGTGWLTHVSGEEDGRSAGSEVVIVTDSNFEHLTQASTGATTGSWLVEFYAPWCGHCKRMEPEWEKLAKDLKGEVNVAKVDVTANSKLGSRFNIKYFPMIKFIHQGDVYEYEGKRDAESFLAFVRGGFKDGKKKPVPPPPTFVSQIMGTVKELKAELEHLCSYVVTELKAVVKGQKSPDPHLFLILGGSVLVFIIVVLFAFAIISSEPKYKEN